MTKSFLRTLLGLTAAVFLSATALPASAATLTYNDPNCAGFQITGSGGSFTLTCGKLACSISGLTTPTTAVGTALTATCTPVASGYLWSLVSGPFSDSTCNAPSQPTSVTTNINKPNGIVAGQKISCLYQVNATSASLSGQSMVTVTWSDAPTAPPVCAPAAVTVPTPMTSAGGNVILGAGCVPNAGVTYTWTRTAPTAGAPTNPTTANPTDTLAANTGTSAVTYTWLVVACTSPTTCDTKSVTTSVPAPGGGGGGGGGSISCSGFPAGTAVIDLPWSNASIYTSNSTGFPAQAALVLRFTVPAGTPPSNTSTPGRVNMNEYVDPSASRYAVLSTTACDFSGTYGTTLPAKQTGISVSFSDAVTVAQPAGITLTPGTTYYINVRNTDIAGNWSCTTSTCNMVINWFIPR